MQRQFPVSTPSAHVSARSQAGGELEQIQFLLGHGSVPNARTLLGMQQRLHDAVNDDIGLERAGTVTSITAHARRIIGIFHHAQKMPYER